MSFSARLQSFLPQARVKGLLADSAWQFGEMGLRIGLNLFVGALIARHLSTDGFGTLSYVAAVITFVVPFVKLGLDQIILREISLAPENSAEILRTAGRAMWAAAIVGTLGILAYAGAAGHPRELALALVVGSAACLASPAGVYYQVLKANFHAGEIARWRIALALAAAAVKLALVFSGAGPMAFVACVVAEEAASNVICYVLARRLRLIRKDAAVAAEKTQLRPLLAAGLPLMVSFALIGIYSRLDVVMLEHMKNMRETGIYSAAFKISELWNCIPGIFVGTFLPHFARQRISDPADFQRMMRRFAAAFFWCAIAVAGFTCAAAPWLVRWLFGPDFLGAIPALRLHVLCFPGVCLGGLIGHWYIIEGRAHLLAVASVAGLLVNAALNWLWIPHFGAAGAAAATAVSANVSVCVPLVLFPAVRHMVRTVLAGIFLRIS